MFEQAFNEVDDVLRKEAGCTRELDYTKRTSWLLFLKYLDGLEQDQAGQDSPCRTHRRVIAIPTISRQWA